MFVHRQALTSHNLPTGTCHPIQMYQAIALKGGAPDTR